MGILYKVFFFLILAECKYDGLYYVAPETKKTASTCAPFVAQAQNRCQDPIEAGASEGVWYTSQPPFQGQAFSTPDCVRNGAVTGRLEVQFLLADQQGHDGQVCALRHQVVPRQRPDVCTTEGPGEKSKKGVLELHWLASQRLLGRQHMVRRMATRQSAAQGERPRQHTTPKDTQAEAEEEPQVRTATAAIQCATTRSTLALAVQRRCDGIADSGRRGAGGVRELGAAGNGSCGVQHFGARQGAAYRFRKFCTGADRKRAEVCCGQDGQSKKEIEGSTKSTCKPTFKLAQVPGRLCEEMDTVCRAVRQGRPGACGQSQDSAGEVTRNKSRCGYKKDGIGGARGGHACGGHGRRDAGQDRHDREHPGQYPHHGLEFARASPKGRSSNFGGRREQEQETSIGGARRSCWRRRFQWLAIASHAAFWQARQVDQVETCYGLRTGSDAVLLNWSHSFTYDPDFTTVWKASIDGLDLAWEMGTLLSSPSSSMCSSTSMRPKRSRTSSRKVRFYDFPETYVGSRSSTGEGTDENFHPSTSTCFTSLTSTTTPQSWEADHVSWMSTGHFGPELQPFRNRDAAAVFDDDRAVHQRDPAFANEELMEVEVEVEEVEDADTSSSESDTAEPRRPAVVFTLDRDPLHCRPRWSSYENLHKDIAVLMELSIHDITLLHSVQAIPVDLHSARIQPFIAQKPDDLTEGSTFQMVLVDVEFHNAQPSLEAETVRRVKLLPMTVSRKAIIALLGLEAHCRYVRNACLVWHNMRQVKTQTRALLNFNHGDYLKVVVPPGRGTLKKFYTREVAQCFRRGYRPSNIPAVLEAHPDGINVVDMPVVDTFNYVPRAIDLDYDRDAMALFQLPGWSVPPFDEWPPFLSGRCDPPEIYCRLTEEDCREPPSLTVSDEMPAEEGRPELRFGETTNFLQILFPVWTQLAAVEQAEEGRVLYVRTWYTDHHRFPQCDEDRPVRLRENPWSWQDTIAEAWDDRIDPDAQVDMYLVKPPPHGTVPHVVIVQHALPELRSLYIMALDPDQEPGQKRELVTAGPRNLRKRFFLTHLHILQEHMVESLIDCMVWHGDHLLDHEEVFPARHGDSFLVIQNHLRDIVNRAAASSSASSSTGGLNLLQTKAKRVVSLEEAIPAHQNDEVRVLRVVWAASNSPHPSFIELNQPVTEAATHEELAKWGLSCHAVLCEERDTVVCLHADHGEGTQHHYVFVNMDMQDFDTIFLHTAQKKMSINEILRHLYALGYWRAVVLSEHNLGQGVHKITFQNQQVVMMKTKSIARPTPNWPRHQKGSRGLEPFYTGGNEAASQQLVRTELRASDIQELFASHDQVLNKDFGNLSPPDVALQALAGCDPSIDNADLDRLIIYTDGSSLGSLPHVPPLLAEEEGRGDTWAFLVLGERYDPPGLKFLGWSAQAVHYDATSKMHLGAHRLGADMAEREGLTWAALWRLSQNWRIDTCFRSDSRTALGQAEGTKGSLSMDESFTILRATFQAIEAALAPNEVLYAHVPGHAGEAWNELCDWLAKQERIKSFYCTRPALDVPKWRREIGHAWMLFNKDLDVPSFCGEGFHAPAPSLPCPALSRAIASEPVCHVPVHFALSACTANVGSLSSGNEGYAGRVHYIRQQMKALKFNFLGLQESRTPEFCSCVDKIYRMASGCDQHHHGVELWINLEQPYAYVKGRPCFLETGDITVVYKDSRILMAQIETRFWRCWIIVAYAPQSGISFKERQQWWSHLEEIAHHRQPHDEMIVLIDANASPGGYDGSAVFTCDLPTSSATPLLRDFVQTQNLFLPCTTEVHDGARNTWTDPSGLHSYCIDYVLLSEGFRDACTLSRTVQEFDISPGVWDHEATAVDLRWRKNMPQPSAKQTQQISFDISQLSPDKVEQALDLYQPNSWETDIETQINEFNYTILDGLHKICPRPQPAAKKQYVNDEAWALRKDKLMVNGQLKDLKCRRRDERLVSIFQLWRRHKAENSEVVGSITERFQPYMIFLDIKNLRLVAQYHADCKRLRKVLRRAKQDLIQQQIEVLPEGAPASKILNVLKPILGPSNLKKLKQSTLPHVRKENGEICTLPNEIIETWLGFFGTMEGGCRVDLAQQRELWIHNLEELRQLEFDIQANQLPRLLDLEAALRRVNPIKAVGPDRIHPGICCATPHRLARKLYGALLKLTVHGQEDLQHKGGLLQPVWKGKGRKDTCSSYRSILISSHIGKSLHRSIRQHQCTLFTQYLQREQLGGRPKVPVTLGVHIGRAFLRAQRSQGHNVAMLYLDLTEAFYRIIRPLIVGGDIDDELIVQVGARLGLSEDLLGDLYQHLAEPPAVAQACSPFHMQNTLKALHVDTHFHVKGQMDHCRTRLGSRPGDCFADVIFSYLWGRLLKQLQVQMHEMGFEAEIPHHDGIHLTPAQWPDRASCGFLGPTWMDDTCVCVSDSDPCRLEQKICHATGGLLHLCDAHGLTPNLQAGKTEVLLTFQGHGSRRMKVKYFGPNSPSSLCIVGEGGARQVRVVSSYSHLGCIIHHKKDNRKEAKRRMGIAQGAFTQHRRHLLQNPHLSLQRRTELFKTLIMSRFSYGTESWTFGDFKHKEYIHNGLLRLFKRLLRWKPDHHACDEDVLVATGINSPTELLRLSRLRYVGTLYKCRDLVPWGLINSDREWIALLHDDLRWVWMQLQDASHLPDPDQHFPAWEYL